MLDAASNADFKSRIYFEENLVTGKLIPSIFTSHLLLFMIGIWKFNCFIVLLIWFSELKVAASYQRCIEYNRQSVADLQVAGPGVQDPQSHVNMLKIRHWIQWVQQLVEIIIQMS